MGFCFSSVNLLFPGSQPLSMPWVRALVMGRLPAKWHVPPSVQFPRRRGRRSSMEEYNDPVLILKIIIVSEFSEWLFVAHFKIFSMNQLSV